MKHLLFLAMSLLLACDTFATPAELESAQILAVQSEPASIGLGESASLSLFAADADGPLVDPEVVWTLEEEPGLPVVGTLERSGSEVTFVAPTELPSLPAAVTVQARIEHSDGPLIATKILLIGGPMLSNPAITELSVNGQAAGDLVVLSKGETVELDVAIDPAPGENVSYAWYARPGAIDAYRSTPTQLIASDDAAEGWLYVVVRDRGGIAYRAIELQVQ